MLIYTLMQTDSFCNCPASIYKKRFYKTNYKTIHNTMAHQKRLQKKEKKIIYKANAIHHLQHIVSGNNRVIFIYTFHMISLVRIIIAIRNILTQIQQLPNIQ